MQSLLLNRDGAETLLFRLRGLGGAAIGAVVGWFLFYAAVRNGYYAPLIPGAMTGLAAGLAAGRSSAYLAIVCALWAFALGLVAEWWYLPYLDDGSLEFFIRNLDFRKAAFYTLGSGLAAWFAFRPVWKWA